MNVEIIDNPVGFSKMRNEWNAVLDRSPAKCIFLTHEWLSAWWEDYGKGQKMLIIMVKEGEEIKAIAPLMITKDRKLQFIGHEVSDYMDIIVAKNAKECFEEIFSMIIKKRKLWDWAEFIYLPKNSPHFELWEKNIAGLKAMKKVFKKDSASVILDLGEKGTKWEDVEKTLPGKRRNDLKRCAKLLSEKGELVFSRISDINGIRSEFVHFVDQHRRRWKTEGLGSQFDDAGQIDHYLNIARQLAYQGRVEIASLKLNDDYIAMAFGYLFGDRYYYYTPTFNPDYSKYSPGNLLIKHLIESFYADGGIKIFDLLRGDEPYKYVWSKKEMSLYRIRIYSYNIRSAIAYFNYLLISLLLPRLQKYPYLRKIKHVLLRLRKGGSKL